MNKRVYKPSVDPETFEESCSDNERTQFTLSNGNPSSRIRMSSSEREEEDLFQSDEEEHQEDQRKKRVTFYSDAVLKSNGTSNYEASLHPLLRRNSNVQRKRKASEENQSNRKNSKVGESMGSGRLETGRVTFEEIHDEFRTMDPDELQKRHKTPYASIVTPGEVDEMRDWAIRKIKSKDRLRNDKMYDFITMVASFMIREPMRLLKTPTGIKRPPPGGIPGTGVPGRTVRRTFAPPTGDPGGPVLGPTVVAQTPPSPLPPRTPLERSPGGFLSPVGTPRIRSPQDQPPPPPPLFGEGEELFPLRGAGFRDQQEELRAREAENAQRMFSLTYWLESPEVIGAMDISADVYGHAKLAFAQLKMRIPHYKNVDNLHRLIDTDEDIIRTYYAQLTAMASNMNRFLNPTRTPLDRNEHRIRKHITMLVQALARFRWDSKKNDFVKYNQYGDHWRSDDGLVIRGRGYSDVDLPTYMLGDIRKCW